MINVSSVRTGYSAIRPAASIVPRASQAAARVFEQNAPSQKDSFYTLIKKEIEKFQQQFGKIPETSPIPNQIVNNAYGLMPLSKLEQNLMLGIKDFKLRQQMIDTYKKIQPLIDSGHIEKNGPVMKSLAETAALSSHLDPIKDRVVCDEMASRLKEMLKYAKYNDIDHLAENIEQIAGSVVHLSDKALPIQGRVMDCQKYFEKQFKRNNLFADKKRDDKFAEALKTQ